MTPSSRSSTPSAEPLGTCRLILAITTKRGTTNYRLRRMPPADPAVRVAWKLIREDGPFYERDDHYIVHVGQFGAECTCEDFVYREKTALGCKHIRALRAERLITDAEEEAEKARRVQPPNQGMA